MKTINLDRINRIHNLIRLKATGNPAELADKLEISERMVFHYISWMKEQGAPISYCKTRKSYVYAEYVNFGVTFKRIREEHY